jgi:hypothetical protein
MELKDSNHKNDLKLDIDNDNNELKKRKTFENKSKKSNSQIPELINNNNNDIGLDSDDDEDVESRKRKAIEIRSIPLKIKSECEVTIKTSKKNKTGPFPCLFAKSRGCKAVFDSIIEGKEHNRIMHPAEYICPECDKKFEVKREMIEHRVSVHKFIHKTEDKIKREKNNKRHMQFVNSTNFK